MKKVYLVSSYHYHKPNFRIFKATVSNSWMYPRNSLDVLRSIINRNHQDEVQAKPSTEIDSDSKVELSKRRQITFASLASAEVPEPCTR